MASSSIAPQTWNDKKQRTQLSARTRAPVDLEAADALLLLAQGPPKITVETRDQAAPRIKKAALTQSDLGELSRVLLPKAATEEFLSSISGGMADECRSPSGKAFEVYDPENRTSYKMTLKKQNATRCFVLQWSKCSVMEMGLKPGDGIELILDGSRFIISKLKNNAYNHVLVSISVCLIWCGYAELIL